MKKILLYMLLCCPLLAASLTGTCKRVVDGDTFILNDDTKVQIWGIDAPEKGQDYASHASGALEKTLKGKKLTLKVKDTDQHGRTVAEVRAGKTDVALFMVRGGFAWHDDVNAPDASRLAAAMEKAQKAGKGLWKDENPVKPSLFRKGKTTAETKQTPPQQQPATTTQAAELQVECQRVLDGDTFVTSDGTKVRLWGIDAPEKGQPYADEARARLKELCEGKTLRLLQKDTDSHNRTVAVVYADSCNINMQMVIEGMAWHYAYFAPDERNLEAAQRAAQLSRKGLWKDANPVNPYDFRKANKK